jgi:hypothetical protein
LLVTRTIHSRTALHPIDRADVRWAIVARMTDLLLPGLFAWGVTVAWPILVHPSPSLAKLLALLSVLALLSGSVLSIRWPAAARMLGVWSFLALCTCVWASVRPRAGAPILDPLQGIAGSLGWALFALGWAGDGGAQPSVATVPSARADRSFSPRSRLWWGAAWLVAFAIAASLALLALAFWAPGRARAMFAHAAAIAGGVALVGAAAEIAVRQQPPSRPGGARHGNGGQRGEWRARLDGAKSALILLALLALLGVGYAWTR